MERRPSNKNQHPGLIVLKAQQTRRTRAQVKADDAALAKVQADNAALKDAAVKKVASTEDAMQRADIEADSTANNPPIKKIVRAARPMAKVSTGGMDIADSPG